MNCARLWSGSVDKRSGMSCTYRANNAGVATGSRKLYYREPGLDFVCPGAIPARSTRIAMRR